MKISPPESHLVEVPVQETAGQIRSCFHQLKKTNKVVAVDGSEGLNGELHLGRLAHPLTKLLHLPVRRAEVSFLYQTETKHERNETVTRSLKSLDSTFKQPDL